MHSILSSLSRLFTGIFLAAVFGIAAVVLIPSSFAHEGGHEDDDAARALLAASTHPRVVAQSELYEVVGVLRNGRLTIYLDRVASNEPVTTAKVTIAIGDGEPANAEPEQGGTYVLSHPRLPEGGSIDVVFNVSAEGGDDLLVGTLAVPQDPGAPAVSAPPAAWSGWIAAVPWPIRHPLALGFAILALGMLFSRFRSRGLAVAAVGVAVSMVALLGLLAIVTLRAESQPRATSPKGNPATAAMSDAPRRLPGGSAFVAKSTQRLLEVRTAAAASDTVRPAVNLIGRVIGDANRTGVVQSLHGGRVVPLDAGLPRIGQAVRKGDPLVQIDPYLPLADRTTISEKTGEIEQLMAVADLKIRRLRPLAERGAVPQSQVDDLEAELEGLRLRREAVRSSRAELELLRAPTDGVIAAGKVVAGQVVQAQDLLFQIVDPKGLWVEALVYGGIDPESLADAAAVATNGQTMALSFRGFSRALQQHASVVHFAIPDPPAGLSVGQPLTVMAKSGAPMSGLIVPRDAVVRSANGEAVVWLHEEPERFEARPVRTQSLDATRLIVADGLTERERVVVRGADLVNQIR